MNKRYVIIACLAAMITVAGAQKKNVLLIILDDLRPQLFSYNRDYMQTDIMVTPNIDAIATDGLVFERAYCQSSTCGSSRASFLFGARPQRIAGARDGIFYDDKPDFSDDSQRPMLSNGSKAPSLPEHFKNNGYKTQGVGKIYHRRTDMASESWSEGHYQKHGRYAGPEDLIDGEKPAFAREDADDGDYADGIHRDNAVAALKKLKSSDEPWFLAVGFIKPHLPFACPEKYWKMYDGNVQLMSNRFAPEGVPLFHPPLSQHREEVLISNRHEIINYDGDRTYYHGVRENMTNPDGQPERDEPFFNDEYAKKLTHGYFACVSFADAMVGDVMKALGDDTNTIVVVTGDHGYELGEHQMWTKHDAFETGLWVPLIIKDPSKEGGKRTTALVEMVDLYPTLCELAGIPKPDHLEGTSAAPLMDNPSQNWKGAAFGRYQLQSSVFTRRWHYFALEKKDGLKDPAYEFLFDLENDPQGNVDVSKKYPAVMKTLRKVWQEDWSAAADTDNNNRPISFEITEDGKKRKPASVSRPGAGKISAAELQLFHNGNTFTGEDAVSIGSEGRISFTIRYPEEISRIQMAVASADGKRKKIQLAPNNAADGFTWASPCPGLFFYQILAKTADGEDVVKTGTLRVEG